MHRRWAFWTVFFFWAFLGSPSLCLAAPSPNGDCSSEKAGATTCYKNGCYTCTGGVWVLEPLLMGNSAAACNAASAGQIKWSGAAFQGCDGTSWVGFGGGNVQSPVTPDGTIGASCLIVGQLAKDASGNLLVCADTPSILQGTSCTSFGAGALTFDPFGGLYVCLN